MQQIGRRTTLKQILDKLSSGEKRYTGAVRTVKANDLEAELISLTPHLKTASISERLFNLVKNIKKIQKCPFCDNVRVYKDGTKGYTKTCCDSVCENYVRRNTFIEKYGVKSYTQTKDFREKAASTMQERYGSSWYQSSVEGKERYKNTLKERYGKSYLMNFENIDKIKHTRSRKFFDKYRSIWESFHVKIEESLEKNLKLYCDKCGNNMDISRDLFRSRMRQKIDPCLKCEPFVNSIRYSSVHKRVVYLLKELNISHTLEFYLKGIRTNFDNLDQISTFHRKIRGCFFDIKIGNLLIEVNGELFHANPATYKPDDIIYWHKRKIGSAKDIWAKDEEKLNIAKKLGYEVMTIWENEVNNDMDLVKLKIKEKLCI